MRVRLTPAGGADRVDGLAHDEKGGPYLKARVRVAPEDGKANAALEKMIAKAYGVAKSKVAVIRGHTARLKTLQIDGASEAELTAFLATFKETA